MAPRANEPDATTEEAVQRGGLGRDNICGVKASVAFDAVVFDLGGVLIDWDPRHLYRQVFPTEGEVERFLTEVCTWEWHGQHDRGRAMAETIPELCAQHPEHVDAIALWSDRYADMIAGEVQGTADILRRLHGEGVQLFVLSNMPAEAVPLLQRFDWMDLFDGSVFSGLEGVMKPEPQIYEVLVERYGIGPSASVFVDDRESNVVAAAELGFQTVHFTDAAALAAALGV